MNIKIDNMYSEFINNVDPILKIINRKKIGDKATNPLLLTKNRKYFKADYRIMLFGQETNAWDNLYGVHRNKLYKLYNEFFWQNGCYDYGKIYGGLWRGVEYYNNIFNKLNKDKANVSYIWNNLIKVGKNGKGRPDFYDKIKQLNKSLILQEVKIYKPQLLLLFSGPNYDDIIEEVFNINDFCGVSKYSSRQIGFAKYEDIPVIRTYHPGYLLRTNYKKYYYTISKKILGEFV